MQLTWSDIWVLQALNSCSTESELDLVALIAVADGIQHAILTSAEFNNAIYRLEQTGLIALNEKTVLLTQSAKSLFAKYSTQSIRNQASSLEKSLNAIGYSSKHDPNILIAPHEFISKGRFNSAVQQYHRKYGI